MKSLPKGRLKTAAPVKKSGGRTPKIVKCSGQEKKARPGSSK